MFPLSWLYACITDLRNYFYDLGIIKSVHPEIPSIVVGNLSVGGTGKTPQIEYLVTLLQNHYLLVVLSRGYKRKTRGFILAKGQMNAEILGDEPFQLYKKFDDLIVAVDENRAHGIEQLVKQNPKPEILLLDDAFQHRKVKAGFTILLTSFDALYVDDYVLPSGNLRERVKGAKRANLIVVTKCPSGLQREDAQLISSRLKPLKSQSVFFSSIHYSNSIKGEKVLAFENLEKYEILLVTGIANPNPLRDYLTSKKMNFNHLKYNDHHHFSEKDLDEIKRSYNSFESKDKLILTTEKDYVRLCGKIDNLYYIEIETKMVFEGEKFDKKIKEYVEQSNGNR